MRATIELPDSVYAKSQVAAQKRGASVEQYIVDTLERELANEPVGPRVSKRVQLPLIPSKDPGSLNLDNFNFDDLLI
jgi:hypothetical protein